MYEMIKYGSVGLCVVLVPILIVMEMKKKKKDKK